MGAPFDACRSIPAHEVAEREGLRLQQRGSRLWACCPLHSEKTASLCFFPDGGWKCFGCNQGGDAVDFYAALHGLTLLEAVKQLDAMYSLHLFIEQPDKTRRRAQAEKDALEAFEMWEHRAYATVADYLRTLEAWRRGGKPWDARYCEALHSVPYWDYLFDKYVLGQGVRMNWDGKRWTRDKQHAFEMRVEFYKLHRQEVEALERWVDAIRKSSAA